MYVYKGLYKCIASRTSFNSPFELVATEELRVSQNFTSVLLDFFDCLKRKILP